MWIKTQDGTYVNDAHLYEMFVTGSVVMGAGKSGNVLFGEFGSKVEAQAALNRVATTVEATGGEVSF